MKTVRMRKTWIIGKRYERRRLSKRTAALAVSVAFFAAETITGNNSCLAFTPVLLCLIINSFVYSFNNFKGKK